MLAPVEDVYTEYLERMCVENDLDQDVISATLRRLGHSTPSINSILGNSGGGHSTSNTSSSSSVPTAKAAQQRTLADREGRPRQPPSSEATETQQTTEGRHGPNPGVADLDPALGYHRYTTAAATTAGNGGTIPSVSTQPPPSLATETDDAGRLTTAQMLLEALQQALDRGSAKGRRSRAHTVARAAAGATGRELPCLGKGSPSSPPSSSPSASDSEPVTTISGNNLSASCFSSASSSWGVDPEADPFATHAMGGPRGRREGSLRPCECVLLQDLALRERELRHRQRERQVRQEREEESRLARRTFIPKEATRDGYTIAAARWAAVRGGGGRGLGDNASTSAGLHGRSISREPVGSPSPRNHAAMACAKAESAKQWTSAAAPQPHSTAMRLPMSMRRSGGDGAVLPSTLPRELHTDKVRRAQEYLQVWEKRERAARESTQRTMWATRCRLLGRME